MSDIQLNELFAISEQDEALQEQITERRKQTAEKKAQQKDSGVIVKAPANQGKTVKAKANRRSRNTFTQ